jgi:hypothetical protein
MRHRQKPRTSSLEHATIPHLARRKLVHRLVDALQRHGELLDDRSDLVSGCERQHLVDLYHGRCTQYPNGNLFVDHREHVHFEVVERDRDRVDVGTVRHEREVPMRQQSVGRSRLDLKPTYTSQSGNWLVVTSK